MALDALGAIGPEAVPPLVVLLRDGDEVLRGRAADALARMGPKARAAVRVLCDALGDEHKEVRSAAAWALGEIAPAGREAATPLLRALDDQSDSVRFFAARALARIGAEPAAAARVLIRDRMPGPAVDRELARLGPAAIPAFIEGLEDKDAEVRLAAARGLNLLPTRTAYYELVGLGRDRLVPKELRGQADRLQLGGMTEATVAALSRALEDPNGKVREFAAYLLGRVGPRAKEGVTALAAALTDKVEAVRREAACSLGEVGPGATQAVPALCQALRDERAVVRAWAARALAEIGPGAEAAIPALLSTLNADDRPGRGHACYVLGRIGPAAKGAVPALTQALKDDDVLVGVEAARALGEIGPQAAAVALADALERSRNPRGLFLGVDTLREHKLFGAQAALALARIEPAKATAAGWVHAARDGDYEVREDVARVLTKVGPAAVPVLEEMLRTRDAEVRWCAARALADIGPAAKSAIPALIEVLADEAGGAYAAGALLKIDPNHEASIVALGRALVGKNESVRFAAARALLEAGPAARAALPSLIELLEQKGDGRVGVLRTEVREHALRVLAQLGGDAEAAVPALVAELKTGRWSEQELAAVALAKLGKGGTAAVPALVGLLDDESTREHASSALAGIGPAAGSAAPALRRALEDRNVRVRAVAAEALWEVAGEAAGVPALVKALEFRVPHFYRMRGGLFLDRQEGAAVKVRERAARALGKMGAKARPAVEALSDLLNDEHERVRREAASSLAKIASAATPATAPLAEVKVRVPDGAHLWVEGVKMNSAGRVLELTSPPLSPGGLYSYEIRASWQETGRAVTETRVVTVAAGARVPVDFTVAAGSEGMAGAAQPGEPAAPPAEVRWYVYRDADSQENHGHWSNLMPAEAAKMIKCTLVNKANPRTGSTCVRVDVNLLPPHWCGLAVSCQPDYWGEKASDAAFDLRKAKKLVFHARGDRGGEYIQVKAAIAGDKQFGDSARLPAETEWVRLTRGWKRYELDLSGVDLTRVVTPFAFVVNRNNSAEAFTFFLDDVYLVMDDSK